MKALFVSVLVLALAACSQAPQPSHSNTAPVSSEPTAAVSSPTPPTSHAATPAATTTLAQYHWQLTKATDKAGKRIDTLFVRADKPLQLDFRAQGVSISNTCNLMHGAYTLADGKLAISKLVSTMMACPNPKLTALDTAVAKYLGGDLGLALDTRHAKPTLTLTTAQGDTLVFTGVPTAETRFGSKGQTVFLEVAPQTKPCKKSGAADTQCLYVRELLYGANGVREGHPGNWHVLEQGIDSYSHRSGVRNVLRVKRYAVSNPPAGASSVAYVLDMVVESESKAQE